MNCRSCREPLPQDTTFCHSCGVKVASAATPIEVDPFLGRTLADKYIVRRRLGQGAFGSVYEAEEPQFRRKVAIKTLHHHMAKNREVVERFRREGFAASALEHPHAVKMYDSGKTEDGFIWIAMEFLTGESMDAFLRSHKPLSPRELLELLGPVCDVLGEAHEKGIIHRDLKPQNIMLVTMRGQRIAKVLDFGISKILEAETVTQSGAMMGTPQYMPPEQWGAAKHADARSDIYALGVIAYQCLSKRLPFHADSVPGWMKSHCTDEPLDLAAAMEGRPLPASLRAAIMQALSKDPRARQQTALEFKQALEAGAAEDPSRAPSGAVPLVSREEPEAPAPQPATLPLSAELSAPHPPKTKRGHLALGALCLAALALGGWLQLTSAEKNSTLANKVLPTTQTPDPVSAPTPTPQEKPLSLLTATAPAATTLPNNKNAAKMLLSVASSPTGAKVMLAGKSLGSTNLKEKELEPGKKEQKLCIVKEGYITKEIKLPASTDKPLRIDVKLEPISSAKERFIDNCDGTVTDSKTRLMWAARDNQRDVSWSDAKSFCEGSKAGGYGGWRLPSSEELRGLPDNKAIKLSGSFLWSKETKETTTLGAKTPEAQSYLVVLGKLRWDSQDKKESFRVLPVRSLPPP